MSAATTLKVSKKVMAPPASPAVKAPFLRPNRLRSTPRQAMTKNRMKKMSSGPVALRFASAWAGSGRSSPRMRAATASMAA